MHAYGLLLTVLISSKTVVVYGEWGGYMHCGDDDYEREDEFNKVADIIVLSTKTALDVLSASPYGGTAIIGSAKYGLDLARATVRYVAVVGFQRSKSIVV